MSARLTAASAVLNRARRRAGLDRNPMRRREDRIQSGAGLILVVVFLAFAPWAAITIAGRVYGSEVRIEHAQAGKQHEITAQVIAPSRAPLRSSFQTLKVSWRDAHGALHKADYPGTASDVGSTTTIWVDRSDHIVAPPHRHAQTISDTALTGSGVILVTLSVLLATYALLRRRLDRSRYRHWDAAWARADTIWGRRRNRPEPG